MIIRSIRLKNIKSYGAGENDAGITVDFQPGVNRIAGRNGHGKSTLIEAIGFALFVAKPNYEESFAIDTYLLRNGSKEGEIDVTFEYKGQAFRIERGLGKASKRRTKVIDPQDDSICAEGDAEVSEFLRHLLGLPSADNLSEIFSKLIGVKQGRLTWPFDSKPTQAKKFFEPLFDVAVFRDCFDKLKPARDQFDEALQAAKVKNAGVIQKINDRADSAVKLKEATDLVQKTENEEKTALKSADEASQKKDQLEKLEKHQAAAASAYEGATSRLTRAEDFLKHAKEQLLLSEKAVEEVTRHTPAHLAYHSAEKELTKLDEQREQRDAIKCIRDKTDADRKNLLTQAEAAETQIKSFNEQRSTKATEQKRFKESFEELNERLSKSKDAFEASARAMENAVLQHSSIASWMAGIAATEKRLSNQVTDINRLEKAVSSWDPQLLARGRERVESAEAALTEATARLNQALERKTTLKAQLDQISGGVCPFLKETCRQFDPEKVQGNLTSSEQAVEALTTKAATAKAALVKAKAVFEPLQVSGSQIAGKQESLSSRHTDFLDEVSDFFPEPIRQAMEALSQGGQPIQSPPAYIELPTTELTPEATTKLHALVIEFIAQIRDWWTITHKHFSDLATAHDNVRLDRTRAVETRAQLEARIAERTDELTRLTEQVSRKEDAKKESIRLTKACAEKCAALDEQLKPFASLPDQIKTQQQRKEENRQGYESFLKAKQVADELTPRKEAVTVAKVKQEDAVSALKEKDRILKAAREAFDPEKLELAREDYQTKREKVTSIQTNLTHARKEADVQQTRYNEWLTACKEQEQVTAEMDRLAAAIDLTELARRLLQKAAPAVAQHLCNRIAARAQLLYNTINPDPIELSWDATRYSVKIVPGDRRFAMLSGGEQTKLALALTLAMIEEFGGLSFCIFDEPTYGVDADSRQKLADAIIEAQSAAGLEQLLLVSHDDAFEGKIEHAILLNKSAKSGSAIAISI